MIETYVDNIDCGTEVYGIGEVWRIDTSSTHVVLYGTRATQRFERGAVVMAVR